MQNPTPDQITEQIAHTRALRARLLADPQRPRYHFVSPEGVAMPFDPNGAIFHGGAYHLMYIFQNEKGHCWGHASSRDLLHWRHHPTALEPGDGDGGIFSGAAFTTTQGQPVIIYHGVHEGNCLAFAADDELNQWQKYNGNPIVPIPKEGDPEHGQYESWDPHAWREGEHYYAIFGGKTPVLFKSNDLAAWRYQGPFITDRRWINGMDASCPDFFPLGDRHLFLFISHDLGAQYVIGQWQDELFHPEGHGMMNWSGGRFFAPETLVDARNRRILWAWVPEAQAPHCGEATGWSGVMSLPRVLSLAADHTLRIEPIPEIEQLRFNRRRRQDLLVAGELPLPEMAGDQQELIVEIEAGSAVPCGLVVRASPDGDEQTVITCDRVNGTLTLDVTCSSLSADVRYGWPYVYSSVKGPDDERVQTAPLALAEDEPLRLRIFLDHSIIEVFANERQCITQRIYPTRADSVGVTLFAQGESQVRQVEAWELAATNPW
jgi:beta-fructofuranosidase